MKLELDEEGFAELTRAARDGDVDAVRRLLDEGADIEQRGTRNATPLGIAADFARLFVMELLISREA